MVRFLIEFDTPVKNKFKHDPPPLPAPVYS